MIPALDPGAITVTAEIHDERVRSVAIASARPHGVARLFVGQPVEVVPGEARRLFALCGVAHAAAAAHATAAALGRPTKPDPREPAALAAERLAELLRATVLEEGTPLDRDTAGHLRDALSALRAWSGEEVAPNADGAVARLAQALRYLGLSGSDAADPNTRLGRLQHDAEAETAFAPRQPDALGPADDQAVIAAVRADQTFAAAPALPGRCVETGAYARLWRRTGTGPTALMGRLRARLTDMADCAAALTKTTNTRAETTPVVSGRLDVNEGFSALESPRGRLYHWLRASEDGRVLAYAIVAPTEWNFHPRGPLVAALSGAAVGRGEDARRRIGRLVAAFDPCVAFAVRVTEPAHA